MFSIFGCRDNLDYREGQTDRAPVDKYHLYWTTKVFDDALNFNYRGPFKLIQMAEMCKL